MDGQRKISIWSQECRERDLGGKSDDVVDFTSTHPRSQVRCSTQFATVNSATSRACASARAQSARKEGGGMGGERTGPGSRACSRTAPFRSRCSPGTPPSRHTLRPPHRARARPRCMWGTPRSARRSRWSTPRAPRPAGGTRGSPERNRSRPTRPSGTYAGSHRRTRRRNRGRGPWRGLPRGDGAEEPRRGGGGGEGVQVRHGRRRAVGSGKKGVELRRRFSLESRIDADALPRSHARKQGWRSVMLQGPSNAAEFRQRCSQTW